MNHPLQCKGVRSFDSLTHEQDLTHETKTLYKCINAMNLLSVHSSKAFWLKIS